MPAGTVTVFGGAAGFGSAAAAAAGDAFAAGGTAVGLRVANSDSDHLIESELGHLPAVEQQTEGSAVAPDVDPFDNLA